MKKREVLAIIDRFAEDINPEELIDELYLKAKLDRSEQAVADGMTIRHDEVIDRSRKWFK